MADDVDELTLAGKLCMDAGYLHAAFVLGREHKREHDAKRHPRKRMVEVKLANGSKAWLDKDMVDGAEERE
jgi:hypothetical protein